MTCFYLALLWTIWLKNWSKSNTPAPYSVILNPFSLLADLIKAYFIKAVFCNIILYSLPKLYSTADNVKAIDAVIIEAETLVPEFRVHTLPYPLRLILKPYIKEPAVKISGFIWPIPSKRDHVDIPLEENGATFFIETSKLPTPITFIKSPGLFKVP